MMDDGADLSGPMGRPIKERKNSSSRIFSSLSGKVTVKGGSRLICKGHCTIKCLLLVTKQMSRFSGFYCQQIIH